MQREKSDSDSSCLLVFVRCFSWGNSNQNAGTHDRALSRKEYEYAIPAILESY